MSIRRRADLFISEGRVTTLFRHAGYLCALFVCFAASGCATLPSDRAAAPPSSDIEIAWGVVTNTPADGDGFVSELILRNEGERVFPGEGWALFFNFGRPIDAESVTPTATIEHVNGDFFRLAPTVHFPPLGPGSRRRITFRAGAWAISESDGPGGFYFVWGDDETGTIDPVAELDILPFDEPEQTVRGAGDRTPVETPALRYAENEPLHEVAVSEIPALLPRPRRVTRGAGTLAVDRSTDIGFESGLEDEAAYLSDVLERLVGARPNADAGTTAAIVLEMDPSLGPEAYRLRIDDVIRISGGDAAGVFYGIQTLRALLPSRVEARPPARYLVSRITVEDAPRFGYRGLHLDVARNFHDAGTVKRLLDLMASYKLNRFHFHLSDDEGWRLAIEELPELTDVGGRRGHTLREAEHLAPSLGSGPYPDTEPGSGYYTREEFVDLLRFADERHIEVVPEIDLPGHARAAILAMEARTQRTGRDDVRLADPLDTSIYESVQMYDDNVVNVCTASTYRFIETVIDDLAEMYGEAGARFRSVHTGGDEVPEGVWERSPACDALLREHVEVDEIADLHDYFLRRFDEILDRHGLVTAGWEEIALTESGGGKVPNPAFLGGGFRPYVWNAVWGWGAEGTAYDLANAGYDVVLSNASALYFDLAYAKHPDEPGFYWAGFVDTKTPFSFIPFDLYKSADLDLMGRPIADDAYENAAQLTLAGREHILGLQGQLWGETVRSPERIDYQLFPRLIALAERAWAERPEWVLIEDDARRRERFLADWNVVANAIAQRELPRLDRLDVQYRVPPPGAVIEDGVLKANVALPGMTIRYTTDGSEPTASSLVYTEPVRVRETVKLRTFTTNGRGSRTAAVAP